MAHDPLIYVPEALRLLGYSDLRSLKRWCRNHGMTLYRVRDSNRLYMWREAFEKARLSAVTSQALFTTNEPLTDSLAALRCEMMDNKPLHIPKSQRQVALKVYCNHCDRLIYDNCKLSGLPVQKCKYGDQHRFKVILHVSGSEHARITRTLETRDLLEAAKIAAALRVANKRGDVVPSAQLPKPPTDAASDKPLTLQQSINAYLKFLNNEGGVPTHRQRDRTPGHLADVRRSLNLLTESIGGDVTAVKFKTTSLGDHHAGLYHQKLVERKFAGSTFDRYLANATAFINWFSEYVEPIQNWYSKINRRGAKVDADAITREEFEKLMAVTTKENGLKRYGRGKRDVRNYYRWWIPLAYRLALTTGRRRLEILSAKWSDVHEDERGNAYIKIEDIKSNRLRNRKDADDKKFVYVPITTELRDVLNDAGWRRCGSNDFIIAPDEQRDRESMCDLVSRSFQHFYSKSGNTRPLSYKSIRKAYITNLSIYLGGNVKLITKHSSDDVAARYIDLKVIAQVAQGFSVFGNNNREHDLEQLRSETNTQLIKPTLEP